MVCLHYKRKQTDRFSVDTINSNRAYLFFIYGLWSPCLTGPLGKFRKLWKLLGARAQVRGYEKLTGAQRSTEKAGATEGIQSVEEGGSAEIFFQIIVQGLYLEILFLMTYIWGLLGAQNQMLQEKYLYFSTYKQSFNHMKSKTFRQKFLYIFLSTNFSSSTMNLSDPISLLSCIMWTIIGKKGLW